MITDRARVLHIDKLAWVALAAIKPIDSGCSTYTFNMWPWLSTWFGNAQLVPGILRVYGVGVFASNISFCFWVALCGSCSVDGSSSLLGSNVPIVTVWAAPGNTCLIKVCSGVAYRQLPVYTL